ncbi:MAG: SIMPL domain-containing protein [Ferruginibacter sp.]
MKKLIAALLLFAAFSFAKAQTAPSCNPYPKTISISGSAEMEIVPDEIYVQIDLKEYKKKGENKVELEKIKSDFLEKCRTVGIADTLISIASYEGSNAEYWYWKRRKKDPDMYSGISYQIKFKESRKMDQLIDALDDDATANFKIVRASHSKIQEFRRQLKIQAIKAAKEKGIYLTEAVNEKLGEAITIIEPEESSLVNSLENNNRMVSQYANASFYRDSAKMVVW